MRRTKLLVYVVMAIILVASILLWSRNHRSDSVSNSVISYPARRADLERTILASGVLEPLHLVSVGAQVSGRLLSLTVALGDHVKAGEIIGEIDSVPQTNIIRKNQAVLTGLQAQRSRALATLTQAQLAFRRQSDILAGKAGTKQDYEAAEATYEGAKADLASAEAQIQSATIDVDIARTALAYTKITAPIDGTVVAVVTKQGQTVIAEQSAPVIVKLADLRTMAVKARISEADVTQLKPGQALHFSILSQPERRYDARLRMIEPAPDQILTDSSTGPSASNGSEASPIYYNGRFEVPNEDNVLRPFMTAQIAFVIDAARGAVVVSPASLHHQKGHEAHLDVLDPQGQPHDRLVHTGIDNGFEVQILDGLSPGELVVLAGSGDVKPDPTIALGP